MSENLKTLYYPSGNAAKLPLNPEHFRMYTHMLCPYAERATLAVLAKAIPC